MCLQTGEETKEGQRQRINFTDKTHVPLKKSAVENSRMWCWYRKRIIDDHKSFKDVWGLAFFYKFMSFSSEINNNHLCPSMLCNWRRHHRIVPCGPASCNKQFQGRGWSGSELHGIWLCIGPLWIWNMTARVRVSWQKHKNSCAVRDGMAMTPKPTHWTPCSIKSCVFYSLGQQRFPVSKTTQLLKQHRDSKSLQLFFKKWWNPVTKQWVM